MRLFYNPFKKKKTNWLMKKLQTLGNFTWANKKAIQKLEHEVNELQLMVESMVKPKRGRPRKGK